MKQVIKIIAILAFMLHQNIIFGEIPAQVAAFKQALQSGVEIANCANCDLRGTQDLVGVNAKNAHLPGVNLQPCVPNDMNKETMMICIPDQPANLTGINLSNANLFSSCIDEAILDNANLTNLEFSNSSARKVSLKGAKVSGIITENSTFCNAIMPDGSLCTDSWTGQGVTISCNCAEEANEKSKQASAQTKPVKTKKKSAK